MTQEDNRILPEFTGYNDKFDKQYTIGPLKFWMLHTFSIGFYTMWWNYQAWRFLFQRENSHSNAAIRVVFYIIYFIPFCYRVLKLARGLGYQRNYSPVLLFILLVTACFISTMPAPAFFIWLLSGLFFLQPLMAFNFVLLQSPEVNVVTDTKLTITEILILVFGGLLWFVTIFSTVALLILGDNPEYQ